MRMFIKRSCFLLFFIFWGVVCPVHAVFDVETLPRLRTRRYSIEPYQKIVVFSASRTGSSLTYNVLKFLFEKEKNFRHPHNAFDLGCQVLKTHRYVDMESLRENGV